MSTTTIDLTKLLTPEQVSKRLPFGNADWVRQQLRAGKLRGSKVGGRWMAEESAVVEMIEAASNSTARSTSGRRRRQRASS